MNEYLNKLFLEYQKATGYTVDLSSQTSQKVFYMWLKERSLIVKEYAKFINKLGVEEKEVYEIGKGVEDSTCQTLNKLGCEALAVTDYYKTFSAIDGAVKNSIIIKEGLPFLNKKTVTTLITQLPIEDKLLVQFKSLAPKVELVLGTYGNSLDNDKEENIKNLKLYESILYLMEDVSVKAKYVDDGVTYMGTVISKPKVYVLDKYSLGNI